MATLEEDVARAMRRARELVEMGLFAPHIITRDAEGKVAHHVILAESKDIMILAAKEAVRETSAVTYVAVWQCWMATPDPKESYQGSASQHPTAVYALIVFGETQGGETAMDVVGVKRAGDQLKTYDLKKERYTNAVFTWNLFERPKH